MRRKNINFVRIPFIIFAESIGTYVNVDLNFDECFLSPLPSSWTRGGIVVAAQLFCNCALSGLGAAGFPVRLSRTLKMDFCATNDRGVDDCAIVSKSCLRMVFELNTHLYLLLFACWRVTRMMLVAARDNSNVFVFRQTRGSAVKALHARSRQSGDWSDVLALCEGFKLSIIVELIIRLISFCKLLKVELVAHHGTDTTETLDELVTLRGTVGDELEVGTKVTVLLGQPLEERHLLYDFHLLAGLLIHELAAVGLLLLVGVEDDFATRGGLESPAGHFQILEDDQSLGGTSVQSFKSILNTVADLARVQGNFVEVGVDELLLLDELDVTESLGGKFDGLVETVLTAVRNINNLDDLGGQTTVEKIGLVQVVLEIGGTSKNQASNVDLVVGDEVLNGVFGDLADVVVTFLLTQTSETQGRLTTTTVLLGKIDRELLADFTSVSRKSTEEGTVTVHDDETKGLVGLEQFTQSLGVELVVAKVQGGVDGLEGLKVNVDLSFLSFGSDDFTTVDNETVRGNLVVELETLLGRGNG